MAAANATHLPGTMGNSRPLAVHLFGTKLAEQPV
jgi:hypothetical protein